MKGSLVAPRSAVLVLAFIVSAVPTVVRAAPVYRGGVVATAHPDASEAALALLRKGGNAVDAAIGAAFALAVVGPYHSGLGGGGFALAFDARSGQTDALDFREVAPAEASRDMFLRGGDPVPELSRDGALSVAVPGAAAGYLALLAKRGRLGRAAVLAPAIRLARQGFVVTPKYQAMARGRLEVLRRDPETARLFLRPNAQGLPDVPPLGTRIVQPELAGSLAALARQGASAFYSGKMARAMVQSVAVAGGLLSLEDLTRYRVRWRAPLRGQYRGHAILTMPPPSAGGLAVVQALIMFETAFPQRPAFHDPEAMHVLVESLRRIFADRARWLGDPAFSEVPLERLASRAYLGELLGGIDREHATPSASLLELSSPAPREVQPEKKNTTHISVVDREGNAVSMTTTLNYGFGSGLVARGTGILLNDEMDDFAAKPFAPNVYGLVTGEANAVAAGKIPLSSMAPTLVFQEEDPSRVMLALGSPGGSTIPTTVIQVIQNVIDLGLDPGRAVAMGRVHHQYLPDVLQVDRWGLEAATRRALQAKGHVIKEVDPWGDGEAVMVDPKTGLRTAGSDPRNEGTALGER